MSTMKRCISLLLVLGILLGILAPAAQAAPVEEHATVDTSDVNIEGTNGFGNLLAQEVAENQQETEMENEDYPGGYSVTDLEIVDNVATVTYDSMEEAILVVALHTEDGMQLLTSATATATPDATVAAVTFEGEMPEYFMASAYLLDQYDYSPLCASYDTPMYTREMQELLASTVDDYDPDVVLNLDEDETTNFAVYADSTIVIVPNEGFNTVASIDDENMTYVIKNADEQMTALSEGDVFVYPYGETEILIVKVAGITVDGHTVTITGADLEMEEVFSHVKVESNSTSEEMSVIEGTGDEGVSYIGLTEDSKAVSPNAVEGGVSAQMSHKFEISKTFSEDHYGGDESGEIPNTIDLEGTLKFCVEFEFDYYVSFTRQYVKFTAEAGVDVNIGVTGKLNKRVIKLPSFGATPMVGVYIGIKPQIEFQASAELAWVASYSFAIGFSYSNDKGVQDLTTPPKFKSEIKLEGTVFFGIDFHPAIEVIGGTVMEVDLTGLVGFEINGKLEGPQIENNEDNTAHVCQRCIQGTIQFRAAVSVIIHFLKCDALKVNLDIFKINCKLTDYFYSITNGTFGLKACPYVNYKVIFDVRYGIDRILPNTEILREDGIILGTTNSMGVLVAWLPLGKTTVTATVLGEKLQKTVEVTKDNIGAKAVLRFGVAVSAKDYLSGAEEAVDLGSIDSGECGKNVYWTLYSNGLLEISGYGAMENFHPFGNPWFDYSSIITSAVIDDNVTTIGNYSFFACDRLSSVEISDKITTIGDNAFTYCDNLSSIEIPDGVTAIGKSAFTGCNSLSSVIIPDSVTIIGNEAFSGCNTLCGIYVDVNNLNYSSDVHGILYDKHKTELVQAPGAIRTCTIPKSVATIGNYAFKDCSSLNSVVISDGVTTIGKYAFYSCDSLSSVEIPDSVTSIGNSAFTYCFSLNSVEIPDSVTIIGDNVFSDCRNLSSVVIGNGVTTISSCAFAYCDSLRSVIIGNSVTSINNMAFSGCGSLSSVVMGNNVTTIGILAFEFCKSLNSVVIPDSVTSILDLAFADCVNLSSVTFQGNAPSIRADAFSDVVATAYYPSGNSTWTSSVKKNYGGTITWVPYTPTRTNAVAVELPQSPDQNPDIQPQAVIGGEYDSEITDNITIKTAAFSGLVPGEGYVLLALVTMETNEPLAAANLLAIDQDVAAEDGTLSFRYIQRTPCDLSYVFVCGASNKNLRDAEITFPEMIADGELQVVDPTVVYDDKTLTEGQDYVITGKVDFTEAGEYTCYIRGIHNYTGLVECRYTVKEAELVNPFTDVPKGSFYYEPVMWAIENGITNGTSATTFGPNDQCMRAHVVTFLWRAVGSPEPTRTDNPFVDVKPGDFYYKPVLWALENGITSGMDATHFGPTSYCNRAQVVTFLYRTMGNPDVVASANPFADVAAGSFYEKPVLWAVENGITNGLSATSFGPNSICNRAQIVTFLYRAFVD